MNTLFLLGTSLFGTSSATSTSTPIFNAASEAAGNSSIFGSIADFAVSMMETLGGIGIALLISLENIFPPIPSEVILPLAGFTASQGASFGLVAAVIWATLGSVVGALALYGIAWLFGRDRTRWFLSKLPLMDINDIDRTEAFFERHERSAVFFGRMVPIFRSLISLPAGVVKMNLTKFILFTTAGSLIWNTALIYAGYVLGENWTQVEVYLGVFSKIVAIAIVLAALAWVCVKLWNRRKKKNSPRES